MYSVILKNGHTITFKKGKFDKWCVYVIDTEQKEIAPYDVNYFTDLKNLSDKYSVNKVYSDFVSIYNLTSNEVAQDGINLIKKISKSYGNDEEQAELIFTLLYFTMIAEQNKQYTKLGKNIKRLAIHMMLIEKKIPKRFSFFF